jgi:hypothetical protein
MKTAQSSLPDAFVALMLCQGNRFNFDLQPLAVEAERNSRKLKHGPVSRTAGRRLDLVIGMGRGQRQCLLAEVQSCVVKFRFLWQRAA